MKPSSQHLPERSSAHEPGTQEIDQVLTLFQQGRYAETESLARQLTERYAKHVFGWKAMGTALLLQGRTADAVLPLQKAVELTTGDAQLCINLGNALAQLGRLTEAEQCYRQVLCIDSGFVDAHHNLGNTLSKLNRLTEAEASYRNALALKPDFAELHNYLGSTLQKLGRHTEAEACYQRAIDLKPDFAKAHRNLGLLLTEQERLPEAEASYRSALAAEPAFTEAHYNLGNTLKKQGKPDAAAASFRTCLSLDPQDRLGARLLLTSLGFEPMPLRAPDSHLEAFYAMKAAVWDKNLDSGQKYYGAKLVAQALKHHVDKSGKLVILDAGCGTGQVGLLIRDIAGRLDGVDMSASMLEKIREKAVYDNIYQSDLESLMANNPDHYDAITCAATLIHFGDLSPVFNAAAICLKKGGLFIFTVFQNDHEQGGQEVIVSPLDGLAKSGCYAHGRNYIIRQAEASGFVVERLDSEIHEYRPDNGLPIMCFVVVLRLSPDRTA